MSAMLRLVQMHDKCKSHGLGTMDFDVDLYKAGVVGGIEFSLSTTYELPPHAIYNDLKKGWTAGVNGVLQRIYLWNFIHSNIQSNALKYTNSSGDIFSSDVIASIAYALAIY